MENVVNFEKKIYEELAKYEIYPQVYKRNDKQFEMYIDGDWKHAHRCAKYVLGEVFDCDITVINVEESDGDWYGATYLINIRGVKHN